MSVAVDTMIMIWGLKKIKPKSSRQDLVEVQARTNILFQNLKDQRIIVPATVVAELLCGIPAKEHGQFVAEIQERFFCPPFDLSACALAARLWQFQKGLQSKDKPKERSCLKADMMIVATAKVAGASKFFSHDQTCRRLAEEAGMQAFDLPTHRENLFDDPELK